MFNTVLEGRVVSLVEECARLDSQVRGEPVRVVVERLHPAARIPVCVHDSDAAADISTPAAVRILPGETVVIPMGIAMHIPRGYAGHVWGRSGLAVRGLRVHDGTIDESYRLEIHVIATNHSQCACVFGPGDRIAQLAIRPVPRVEWSEGAVVPTARGGLGSTGMGPLEVTP